jgi:hypothetical protein
MDDLIRALQKWKLPTSTEAELQSAIVKVLEQEGIAFLREATIDNGIIDFLIGRTGLECKIAGSKMSVTKQLMRYCDSPAIDELLLATNVASHRCLDGTTLRGKKIRVYWLSPFM